MSNYNLAINWAGKDALSDSDPDKVISGDDFNTEFTAVKTAVNTKAELNGSASESFSATTATAGTNTTQVATTAFVTTAISNAEAFPVGSIFMGVVSTNPATLLGYGTWAAFGEGRMPIGVDSTDTDFDTAEETGGAKTHTLTESEMPSHNHNNGSYDRLGIVNGSNTTQGIDSSSGELNLINTATIQSAGGGSAHNNMPPYIAVYMWKRTA